MNETTFRETLINILRFDSKYENHKSDLLIIITRSTINRLSHWEYAKRSGQHYEEIEIRAPVPLINFANKYESKIKSLFEYVYEETDEYALRKILVKPQIISSNVVEYIQNDVVFNDIQENIIQGIRDAKYLIWIAVA